MRSVVLAVIALIAMSAHAGSDAVTASFKAVVLPQGSSLTVGDLVRLNPSDTACARMLAAQPIPENSRAGMTRIIDRSELLAALNASGIDGGCDIRWKGANYVTVRKRGIRFDMAAMRRQVGQALTAHFEQRYQRVDVQPLAERDTEIEIPADAAFSYSISRDLKPQKRTMIVAHLNENTGSVRSYPLWFSVSVMGDGWVLDHALERGQAMALDGFHAALVDVSALGDDLLASDANIAELVAKMPIPAGAVLRKSQFIERPEIEVGEPVTLRYQQRNIALETKVIALQSSRLGERVLVRAPIGSETIAARTIARGVAEVLP